MSDIEISDIVETDADCSISDIVFKGKSLMEWERQFTINIPSAHITNQEMQRVIIALNNKYHLAYNCYNELLISYGKIDQSFNARRGVSIKTLIASMREDGAGRMPAKEVLAEMAIASDTNLKELHQQLMTIDILKTFFENNKIKLEKTMQLVINLSFMISASDKIHYKSGDPTI